MTARDELKASAKDEMNILEIQNGTGLSSELLDEDGNGRFCVRISDVNGPARSHRPGRAGLSSGQAKPGQPAMASVGLWLGPDTLQASSQGLEPLQAFISVRV